jgi:hypothetical protein
MPEKPETTERQIWGVALRALRKRSGRTIYEAAAAYEPVNYTPGDPDKGVTSQRWQQIEQGQLRFTDDQRARLARALGADVEELELERARILGHRRTAPPLSGLAEREPRGLVIPIWGRSELDEDGWKVKASETSEAFFDARELLGPSIGMMHMPDDAMHPKAEAGDLVIFDRSRRPRPERGCVVETNGGELYPRLFLGIDDQHVLVRSLKSAKAFAFRRTDVKGVYAVRFWGD